MLVKTKGVVLKYIKFRETSIIATIFTEVDGMRSYLVNGVRTTKPKVSVALFEPLTLIDIVAYHKENDRLSRLSEIKCDHPYVSIPLDVKKCSILLFLSEILTRMLRHESHPAQIFSFIRSSILMLDTIEDGYENFHIQFLLKFTQYLGFYPMSAADLKRQITPGDPELDKEINHFLQREYTEPVTLTNQQRWELLDNTLEYYKLHVEGLGEIKSASVLHEVLSS